ncbi:MAG: hypothetical protein HY321_14410 [Armatimonadetes bacterium]|nr:hypothetical protein [Armatimonadota bacterium]
MKILRIDFEDEKARITISMTRPFNTSEKPHLARGLFRLLPRLKKHRCYNDGNLTFQREAACTEIAHLMEHLVLELQAVTLCGRGIRGVTYWNWKEEPTGCFHVDVDAPHPGVALGAVALAWRIIRAVDARHPESINIEQELRTLRTIAALPPAAFPTAPVLDFERWEEEWTGQVAHLVGAPPGPTLAGVPG